MLIFFSHNIFLSFFYNYQLVSAKCSVSLNLVLNYTIGSQTKNNKLQQQKFKIVLAEKIIKILIKKNPPELISNS